MIRSSNYNGSKFGSGVYQRIINLVPVHDIYIEGFAGSAAIFKLKKKAKINMLFEINPDIITPLLKLSAASVYNLDFINWLQQSSPFLELAAAINLNVVMYLDPPYLINSRKSKSKIYKYELTESHHITLLNELLKLNCYVIINCYPNELYSKMLINWNKIEYNVRCHASTVKEVLYFNFPESIAKNEYTFLGSNYRERAQIKARVSRSIAKLLKLPPDERNWILSEVTSKL